MLRQTPVRKKPRNIDASRGSEGPMGDDSGENSGIDGDPDRDPDHSDYYTHVNYLATGYVKTCGY